MSSKGIHVGALLRAVACLLFLPANPVRGQDLGRDQPEDKQIQYLVVDTASLDRVFTTRWDQRTDAMLRGSRAEVLVFQGRGGGPDRAVRQTILPLQDLTELHSPYSAAESSSLETCSHSPIAPEPITRLAPDTARRHVDPEPGVAVATAGLDFHGVSRFSHNVRLMQLMPETALHFIEIPSCDPYGRLDDIGYSLDEFQNSASAVAAHKAGEESIHEPDGIPSSHETFAYVAKVSKPEIGLSEPGRTSDGVNPNASAADAAERGVIRTRRTGEFIGGVMHFQHGASHD